MADPLGTLGRRNSAQATGQVAAEFVEATFFAVMVGHSSGGGVWE